MGRRDQGTGMAEEVFWQGMGAELSSKGWVGLELMEKSQAGRQHGHRWALRVGE